MGNKDRPKPMVKKPKKDAKLKPIKSEPATPAMVEVVKRKRKEREPEED
ncbi:MAG TPA: hypothetical protein VFZ25_03805 [Chloroflexota bacterium]|nr:hypothetical protein [Chloroflexota bacterium]